MARSSWFFILAGVAVGAFLLALSGCNTVKGFGKDVHDVAQHCQDYIEGSDVNNDTIPPDNSEARARP